jgi:hypothetical protein
MGCLRRLQITFSHAIAISTLSNASESTSDSPIAYPVLASRFLPDVLTEVLMEVSGMRTSTGIL